MPSPAEVLALPVMRTAALELSLLAVTGGVLGAWIVLRRLAFFTHAVGAAVFPALVLAAPLGMSPALAAMVAGLGYAGGVGTAGRGRADPTVATGLLLVASLAAGVVLASDVVDGAAVVDRLLFGTLLGLDEGDVGLAAGTAALAVAGTLVLGRAWLGSGFDRAGAQALGVPVRLTDTALLMVVAAAAVAAVPAVGALLVTSMFVVPAATARLVTSTPAGLFAGAVVVAALQGGAGLYLAFSLDVSPGPAIAVLGATLYGAVALAAGVRERPREGSSAAAPATPEAAGGRGS